ncbi:MAG: CRTAC1 family protein, partial [Acidobacteria bacterium]|nr:CRTAC1 family protein [Acidobacteriota bacterium]NIM64185.1 CRTAC1 family protein [Acidobacteriota bacterium]NIO59428.1 CRTAC1 family protein [Acidobacteriota bacterium]NIQ30463.1 CRTAC1 family protein [Acidobacteriota bacterium]NIQ85398.1 CRTAC1 family protein [Acidobacteriota bacterium]
MAGSSGVSAETVSGGNQEEHLLGTTGTGVAVADYDNDGDLDLYLATAQTVEDWVARRRPHANKLYRNDGDATFSEVAPQAGVDLHGWSNGVYFVDYDNDDDKDLFVTAWGPNVLYENNGDGTFADVTERAGLSGAPDGWSTSAAFADLDSDGDLDVYVANYVEYDLSSPPTTQIWQGIE